MQWKVQKSLIWVMVVAGAFSTAKVAASESSRPYLKETERPPVRVDSDAGNVKPLTEPPLRFGDFVTFLQEEKRRATESSERDELSSQGEEKGEGQSSVAGGPLDTGENGGEAKRDSSTISVSSVSRFGQEDGLFPANVTRMTTLERILPFFIMNHERERSSLLTPSTPESARGQFRPPHAGAATRTFLIGIEP